MRLLFVADGRSPTAINWMRTFADLGHELHLASTFPCELDFDLASFHYFPVAFSGTRSTRFTTSITKPIAGAGKIGLRLKLRHWLGPWTVSFSAKQLEKWMESLKPDLVHAMRIPFEGMLATSAKPTCPLLISVWGNDFSLHAPATPWMKFLTRRTLRRASALQVDCYRDQRLALEWGFPSDRPVLVIPGGGGVRDEFFYPKEAGKESPKDEDTPWKQALPGNAPVVVNPRGFRAYVRNDTFFKAIPRILTHRPETVFLCPAMAGEPEAEAWLDRLAIRASVHLLPKLTPEEMGALFRRALVTVSVTQHDGTPNSLLEAMACGCFPVVGDLESIREWIEDDVNGILVRPDDADGLATAVLKALADQTLRQRAELQNLQLIEKRASHTKVMAEAEAFYRGLLP